MLEDPLTIALKDHEFSPHFHDSYALGLILDGKCIVNAGSQTCLANPGDLIIIHPWEIHTAAPEQPGSTLTYKVFYTSIDAMNRYLPNTQQQGTPLRLNGPVITDPALSVKMKSIFEKGTPSIDSGTTVEIQDFLAQLCTRHAIHGQTYLNPSAESSVVLRACQYVEDHLDEPITLTELATFAGVSRYHFCRVFGRITGLSPLYYVRQTRAFAAKDFILSGMALAEVAAATGFADQAHMTRSVKALVGMTPGRLAAQSTVPSLQ